MPLRSYLVSDEAKTILAGKRFSAYVVCRRYWNWNLKEVKRRGIAAGGEYIDGIHFTYQGGQIRSLLSLLSYFGKGEMRERSFGIKIPPTNLKADFGDEARRSPTRSPTASRPGRRREPADRADRRARGVLVVGVTGVLERQVVHLDDDRGHDDHDDERRRARRFSRSRSGAW